MTLAYLLVCGVMRWRVAAVDHIWLASVLGVAYHFLCEAHNGQTIGKRQYGLRVVSADGGQASARAIAIRTVLRFVDALPTCYLSGLVSMLRTGAARRRRIGDLAAQTMVVAVEGRALNRGTPGWILPVSTIVALSPGICECILTRLEAKGYNTTNAQSTLLDHLREDATSGTLSPDSRNMLAAANACRVSPPAAPGPLA